jgi:hypothetical protein
MLDTFTRSLSISFLFPPRASSCAQTIFIFPPLPPPGQEKLARNFANPRDGTSW